MPRLSDRLRAARDHLFVGRDEEVRRFEEILTADALPVHVLHVFGPGGVGKTALLQAFEAACERHDARAVRLDVRDVDPSPAAFRTALRTAAGVGPDASVLTAFAQSDRRTVLLIDTYESIDALDGWLRDRFLPDLSQNTLVVLAGRSEPNPAWRTDPGWRPFVERMPLRNLDGRAGRALLARRDVPEAQHERILQFTHGHPLATSLVADLLDQRPGMTFEPEAAPDVVKTVLEQFVQHVPSPAHRAALEAAALVRFTTEALLKHVLDAPDVHALFEWLRSLSFVTAGERGLVLHDLARTALAADLRWRNPDWHDTLHERARRFYTDRLKHARSDTVSEALSDYTFLLRRHPLIQPFYQRLRSQWGDAQGLLEDDLRAGDRDALTAMTRRHEGEAAAEIAAFWLEQQPGNVHVYRRSDGSPAGFQLTLALHDTAADERERDPVAQAAWEHLEAHAPLRAEERASVFRFWMAEETYQDVSPVQSLIFIRQVRHYLSTPHLAFTALCVRDSDRWAPLLAYADMQHLENADATVGDRTFALFGHDWRAMPPGQWLDLLAERGFSTDADPADAARDRVIVLSRDDFADALKDAFRGFHRPDALRDNPLLYARFVDRAVPSDADTADRVETLCQEIETTTRQLEGDPRDEKYFRAVHRTYLNPAPTQEKAAEALGVPFSTFRRHLTRGLDRVTDILWEREVDAA